MVPFFLYTSEGVTSRLDLLFWEIGVHYNRDFSAPIPGPGFTGCSDQKPPVGKLPPQFFQLPVINKPPESRYDQARNPWAVRE